MAKYIWEMTNGGEEVLHLSETMEGWVIETEPSQFEATLLELSTQVFLWSDQYDDRASAKRALIACAKRLGYLQVSDDTDALDTEIDASDSAGSIWEWEGDVSSHCTWFEGNGLEIDGVVTARKDGLFEGDVVLGAIVLRQEYKDEWSAKRGVITRADWLIDQAVPD